MPTITLGHSRVLDAGCGSERAHGVVQVEDAGDPPLRERFGQHAQLIPLKDGLLGRRRRGQEAGQHVGIAGLDGTPNPVEGQVPHDPVEVGQEMGDRRPGTFSRRPRLVAPSAAWRPLKRMKASCTTSSARARQPTIGAA